MSAPPRFSTPPRGAIDSAVVRRVVLSGWLLAALLGACGSNHSPSVGQPFGPGDATVADDTGLVPEVDAAVPGSDVSLAGDAAVVGDTGPLPTVSDDAGRVAPGAGPYPLVFVHGFAGFRDLGPINYFYNVAADLRARGETVFEPALAPFAAPSVRAPMLARALEGVLQRTGRGRVVLIAHSQAGLDARYLISTLGWGDRVAALVTVSSPHRGTRLADALLGNVPEASDVLLNAAATFLGFTYNEARARADLRAALTALSEAESGAFNRANPDDPRVRYFSYAGRSNGRNGRPQCDAGEVPDEPSLTDEAFFPLAPFARLLERGDPARWVNDGLITVESARWGRFMGCVPADHFDEVGQIAHRGPVRESGFDHVVFYRDMVRRLRQEGL